MNTPFVHFKIRTSSHLFDSLGARFSRSDYDATPFFILGSGRNGSTLLASVLNNHSQVFVPGEHPVIPTLIKYALTHPFASWQQLVERACQLLEQTSHWELNISALRLHLNNIPEKPPSVPYLLDNIYCYYGSIHHKDHFIWADKTPANTKFAQLFKAQFPKSKFIFLLRDPRDVVSSYFSIERNSKPLSFLLWRWQNSILKYDLLSKKHPGDVRLLKYEDFVVHTEEEIAQIVQWLGLPPMYDAVNRPNHHLKLLGVENVIHHENIRHPITTKSIGRWKKELDPVVVGQINQKLNKLMKRMGYV